MLFMLCAQHSSAHATQRLGWQQELRCSKGCASAPASPNTTARPWPACPCMQACLPRLPHLLDGAVGDGLAQVGVAARHHRQHSLGVLEHRVAIVLACARAWAGGRIHRCVHGQAAARQPAAEQAAWQRSADGDCRASRALQDCMQGHRWAPAPSLPAHDLRLPPRAKTYASSFRVLGWLTRPSMPCWRVGGDRGARQRCRALARSDEQRATHKCACTVSRSRPPLSLPPSLTIVLFSVFVTSSASQSAG